MYTIERLNEVAGMLRALPAIDDSKRKLDKQGAVRHLASEIGALQARGYTVEQVAESLTTAGIEITTPTLKSYLQRIKKPAKKTARKLSAGPATAGKAGPGAPSGTHPAKTPPSQREAQPQRAADAAGGTRNEFTATDRTRL